MDQKEVRRYLSVIKRAVTYIESMLDDEDEGLLEQMTSPAPQQLMVPQQQLATTQPQIHVGPTLEEIAKFEADRKKHVAALLSIDCWPEAMPFFFTAKEVPPADQKNRANAVLDMMVDRSFDGMNFLDYGCGDGWITQEVIKRGVIESTGYDIVRSPNWDNLQSPVMINNFEKIKHNHYDIVFLYDVIDHAHDPLMVMAEIKRCVRKDGAVYVRCHPWTSRHATHLFKKGLNKAYIHLFLKWKEISDIIKDEPMFTREEKNPIDAYHWWFKDFDIKKERYIKEPVSEFFHVPAFKELLANEQQIPLKDIDDFLKLLEIQFIDYVLTPKR